MKLIKTIVLLIFISTSFYSAVIADSGNKGQKEKSPLISSINPDSGRPGQMLTVSISGQNSYFTQGTNMIWFEQGTSTIQAFYINPLNDTLLNAAFSLPYSPIGYYDVNCYSSYNGMFLPLENGFSIVIPSIKSINPEAGNPGQTLSVTISGQNTHFTQGSNMIWFEQGSSTIQAFDVNSVNDTVLDATFNLPYSPLGYYDVRGYNNFDGTIAPLENGFLLNVFQNYDLETGFQFISSQLIPENSDMLIVMADVLNENLVYVRNSQGQTLRKIGPIWVNGIGDWIVDEGYLVKMNANDSFSISGDAIDPSTPIPVEAGFQFVSYFPSIPMDALMAFETIIGDNLEFIRNSQGQTLRKIGPIWVNGLGNCQPGEGYLVKMFVDDILIYPFTCGDPLTDTRDGQTYSTVQIGDQCWMAENLNIGEYVESIISGVGHSDVSNNGIIEKYCHDNNTANCDEYGGLYDWNEMMQYTTTQGVQGICLYGWHIPIDDEWTMLADFLGGESVAGGKMKETGTAHWNPPNTAATNESGFTALPGDHRSNHGSFGSLSENGNWWSSTQSTSYAWRWWMHFEHGNIFRNNGYKTSGFSVRCVKDYQLFDNSSILGNSRPYELSDKKNKNIETVYFHFKGGNPAEAVYTIYIEGLEIGDEIAAFDGDKIIGALKINSENTYDNELPVFSTIVNGKGYESGKPIILKIWDSSTQSIIPFEYAMIDPYNEAYTEKVYPSEDGLYSIIKFAKGVNIIENTEEAISIFPNPSNGIFNISIEGVCGKVQMKVFDVHGNAYRLIEIEGTGNIITKQLDLNELPTGVYFISFSGEDFSQVKKIVIQ